MNKNRFIPFGYSMENGEIVINKREGSVVVQIYQQYLSGASLQSIATMMTELGVPYQQSKAQWDKSMVKRILENPRYTGLDRCPELISKEIFDNSAHVRKTKKNYHPALPSVGLIRKKAVCAVCGERVYRNSKGSGREKWACKSKDCLPTVRISDEIVLSGIMAKLNKLRSDPKLVQPIVTVDNRKSIETIRLQNEINHEMNKTKPDREHVRTLLFRCAAQKYKDCADYPPSHITKAILTAIARKSPQKEFDVPLFTAIVGQVKIDLDGSIQLTLSNQITL